jgi:hypothetical protein
MIRIKHIPHINTILLFSAIGTVLMFVVLSLLFDLPSTLLILSEVMLFLSLFIPGYLVQFVLTHKLMHVTLSKGEHIACSFALSLFLISSLSFITSFTGTGLRETFYGYYILSLIMLVIVLLLNRNRILHKLSSLFKAPRLSLDNLILFSLLFLIFPLFHLFGFTELNWDGFNFFLRDALAISISNSISAYYPESFYDGSIPLIFNSYLSSVMYSYGLNILNIMDFDGGIPRLMEYTNLSLSFIVIATLLATTLLLRSFAHQVFKDRYLVAATIIIFLTAPLLNQFFYVKSLNADLFFAFATLLVLVFGYKYLQTHDRGSRYFSLLMIVLGLSLAITTKNYGYPLLLIIPLLCLKGLRKGFVFSNFRQKTKDPAFPNYLSRMIVLVLFAILIGFASLYTIRSIMLTGSPFGYLVHTLVNYSENERWADHVISLTGIHLSLENYPPLNQNTALLLSYGLFPVFLVPLLVGTFLLIKKEFWGFGIIVIYILFYYLMFATVLGLRSDRHLFSIIALLSPICVYGLKIITGYLGWTGGGRIILCMTMILCVLQIPLFDAIYPRDFKVTDFFPSIYYWYTTDNLVKVLGYSLIAFGVVVILGKIILAATAKQYREWYIFGALFGITVLAIIGLPTINLLEQFKRYEDIVRIKYPSERFGYEDFMSVEYATKHFAYPMALQEFIEINGNNSSNRVLYLHGLATEFLTMGHASYLKIDDFRMLADLKDVIEEKNANKVHELLLSKDIKYILYPSEINPHYRKLAELSKVTDNALIFDNPSSITTEKIRLNDWWDLYIV